MGRPTLPTPYELQMRSITTYPEGYEDFVEYLNRCFYTVYNNSSLCISGNLRIYMGVFDDLNIDIEVVIKYLEDLGYKVKIDEYIYFMIISW